IAVVMLAALLIAESERRVTIASIGGLGLIVLLAMLFLQVEGLPKPQANADLGLAESQIGDPPLPTPEGGQGPGGTQNNDGNQGQQQNQQQQQGGGQGQQQQQQQVGGGE